MAKQLFHAAGIPAGIQRLAEFIRRQADLRGRLREHLWITDVLALLKEGTHHTVVKLVAAIVVLGEFQAFECKPGVGLWRNLRQLDVNAHPLSEGIDGLPPRVLQVRALGTQSRSWIGT